jgi:hypothetical protein
MRNDMEGKANLQEYKNLKPTDHVQTDIYKKPTGADNTATKMSYYLLENKISGCQSRFMLH